MDQNEFFYFWSKQLSWLRLISLLANNYKPQKVHLAATDSGILVYFHIYLFIFELLNVK